MQLGPNGNRTETTPVLVSTDQDFTDIATGSAHTCALAMDGRLFCWGMSPANGLDIGSFDDPREVGGGRTFRQVSAGTGLNCALDPSGTLWCMGEHCRFTCSWAMQAGCEVCSGATGSQCMPSQGACTACSADRPHARTKVLQGST